MINKIEHVSRNVAFTFRDYIIPEGNDHVAGSHNTNMIPDRCFDRITVAKNGEVRVCLCDTGKNRCDKASSIKYLKRVGFSFLDEGSGRTNFTLRFIPRDIYSLALPYMFET